MTALTSMLILLPILLVAISIEIYVDNNHYREKGKSDKPETTIARICFWILVAFLLHNVSFIWTGNFDWRLFAIDLGFQLFIWIGLFDYGYSLSRWRQLPPVYYQPLSQLIIQACRKRHSGLDPLELDKIYEKWYGDWMTRNIYIDQLTNKQKRVWRFKYFYGRLGYHGTSPKKWTYDWFWFTFVPPHFEFVIKGIIVGLAIYFYLLWV